MKKIVPHFIAIGIFILIAIVYCSPILKGRVLSAHDLDTFKGMSKEVQDFREQTGEESLWTKSMFSGMPTYQILLKNDGNLMKYVDKVFQFGLPRPANLIFLYLIGFYILLLMLKIDFRLAIVGSIAFAFSSYYFIIIQAGHMSKAHAIAYLPLIVGAVLFTFRSKKWILGAILTALFVSLQLLANHYQITYYTIIILFFIGLVEFVKQLKAKTLPIFLKKSAVLVLAALLGGATNYTRLATTMEYGPETQRGKSELTTTEGKSKGDGLALEYATQWSYGKLETMTFLIPNFMGGASGHSVLTDEKGKLNRDSETYNYLSTLRDNNKVQELQQQTSTYWGDQPGTAPTYVGAIVMLLFVLGLFCIKSSFRIWILISTLLSIMLGWGNNWMWLTEFFFNYVPAYNKFRAVTMIMVVAEFGIALFAILALNQFLDLESNKEKEKKLKYAFYIIGGITLLFALVPSLFVDFLSTNDNKLQNEDFLYNLSLDRASILKSDAWRSFAFVLLAFFALWIHTKGYLKKQYLIGLMGLLILLDMWTVDKRYLNEEHFVRESNAKISPTTADLEILNQNKNHARVFNLNNPFNESRTSYFHHSIGGYHAAKLLRYQEIIDQQLSKNNTAILSMLNCGWIITPQGQALPSVAMGVNPLGHAWFVSEVKNVPNADKEMESLNAFDPATTAIVDERFAKQLSNFTKDAQATIALDITNYKPNHLIYHLNNIKSNQMAVFSEIYYEKGWNAYIDGKKVPHFRANYILRSMMVPKGTTKVEFKFEPESYRTGRMVAISSSVILLLLLGFVSYKEFKK